MERKFNKGDIVQHFKREKMTEEQLKEEPNLYLRQTKFQGNKSRFCCKTIRNVYVRSRS